MGKSYFVPRSAKGETRILYIFTVKSFITTIISGLIGAGLWYLFDKLFQIPMVPGLILTGIFGAIGFVIGAAKIPDSPIMGKFRKAGGETLLDIMIRFITFRKRKKIYIYNLNRGGK